MEDITRHIESQNRKTRFNLVLPTSCTDSNHSHHGGSGRVRNSLQLQLTPQLQQNVNSNSSTRSHSPRFSNINNNKDDNDDIPTMDDLGIGSIIDETDMMDRLSLDHGGIASMPALTSTPAPSAVDQE